VPTITAEYKRDMAIQSKIGNHALSFGGHDGGPTPSEGFICSIASCIAAVVADYCNNSGINAEGLSVSVSYEWLRNPSRMGNTKAVVRLPNCQPGKKARSILHVARNCPVYKSMLHTTSEIDVALES